MTFAVLRAVASRLEREGRLAGPLASTFLAPGQDGLLTQGEEPLERPARVKLRAAA